MQLKKGQFVNFMGIKANPNEHEKHLFRRAKKYISLIAKIRGIKMIAICNSLSMYSTKKDSDIDLFIVTEKNMIWYVRFFVTLIFWKKKVWRHNDDITENFCLSFFATTESLGFKKIALKNDIYLYYWIYYLKPIINYDNTYEKFLQENYWVNIDNEQQKENTKYIFGTKKSKKIYFIHYITNKIIQFFLKRKTLKNFEKLGKPKGIIVSDSMLKFHDHDQRENIIKSLQEGKKTYQKDFSTKKFGQ